VTIYGYCHAPRNKKPKKTQMPSSNADDGSVESDDEIRRETGTVKLQREDCQNDIQKHSVNQKQTQGEVFSIDIRRCRSTSRVARYEVQQELKKEITSRGRLNDLMTQCCSRI
jgi:hypothetical protein